MLGCLLVLVLVLTSVLAGCHRSTTLRSAPPGPVTMTVSARQALLDVPVNVSLGGLPAGARTTVTATAVDRDGTAWTSTAQFQASTAGAVSLGQASLAGSYTGVNPMGLFEFMAPTGNSKAVYFPEPVTGYDVSLVASVGGHRVAATTTHRQSAVEVGVTTRQLRPADSGVYGELFSPANTTAGRPAVLLFGGSEGGMSMGFDARMLAAHGYPALSLAYFKEPGLPQSLTNVPLEYFAKALAVLRRQPGVDPKHVLVFGVSRGSEAALLLGSHFPQLVNGVIAGVPSSMVNPGYPNGTASAWTLDGEPVPGLTLEQWKNSLPADPRAVIPVERIRGPVLLTCGLQDQEWPSCTYQDAITARLGAHHFGYQVTTLQYSDAGHDVGSMEAIYSATAAAFTLGGSLVGNQAALTDAHAKLLKFLADL